MYDDPVQEAIYQLQLGAQLYRSLNALRQDISLEKMMIDAENAAKRLKDTCGTPLQRAMKNYNPSKPGNHA